MVATGSPAVWPDPRGGSAAKEPEHLLALAVFLGSGPVVQCYENTVVQRRFEPVAAICITNCAAGCTYLYPL